jgi:PPOX class probable F420-dependent enzyme
MSPEVQAFLYERRFGVLSTINNDGSPQQTVMWFMLEDGAIVMNTRRGRKKDRNLVRDPRASLCVEEELRYVTIRGRIEIDDDPKRGQETIRALATRYDGARRAEELMESDFRHQHRVTYVMSIDHVDAHGFEEQGENK